MGIIYLVEGKEIWVSPFHHDIFYSSWKQTKTKTWPEI